MKEPNYEEVLGRIVEDFRQNESEMTDTEKEELLKKFIKGVKDQFWNNKTTFYMELTENMLSRWIGNQFDEDSEHYSSSFESFASFDQAENGNEFALIEHHDSNIDEAYRGVKEALKNTKFGENFCDYLNDEGQDDFSDAIYELIELEISIDEKNIKANILLKIGNEMNYEFTNTEIYYDPEKCNITDECILHNSITWLLKSQGYTVADLYSEKSTPFLNSLRQELDNTLSQENVLTFLWNPTLSNLEELLVSKKDKNFEVGIQAMIGLYSPSQGSGSVLEIELEKPLVFNKEMIYDIQIEGADREYGMRYGYNVNSVYGISGDAWQKCVSPTEKEIVKIDSDFVKKCFHDITVEVQKREDQKEKEHREMYP